jgi:hypothetical protein
MGACVAASFLASLASSALGSRDEVLYLGALLHSARHPEAYRGSFTDL